MTTAVPVINDCYDPLTRTSASSGGYTNDNVPVLQGTAVPRSTVDIFQSGILLGSVVADPITGDWSCALSAPLGEGTNLLTATATLPGDTPSAPSAVFTIKVDTHAPTENIIIAPTSSDGHTISGTILGGPLANGTTPPNAAPEHVQVSLDGGATWANATVASSGTSWSYTSSTPLHSSTPVVVRLVDDAGNVGTQASQDVLSPPVAPVMSTYDDTVGSITGIFTPSTHPYTDDTDPILSGTATAGSTVTISESGVVLGVAVADASGHWSCVPSITLGEGTHQLTATASFAGGPSSPASTVFTLTVDHTAPAEVVSIAPINNGATVISGTLLGGPLAGGGTSIAPEHIEISLNGGVTWAYATVAPGGTSWTYTSSTPLAAGVVVEARVWDEAGNASAPVSQTVGGPPVFTDIDLSLDPASGAGGVSYTPAPTIDGTVITSDSATQADMKAGTLTATLFLDSNGNGILDPGEQIVATNVPVSATGTFEASGSLTPGSYVITAALENSGIFSVPPPIPTVNITVPGLPSSVTSPIPAGTGAAHVYTVGTSNAGLGYSMSAIGDFNGDGYTDYIVSAPISHQGAGSPGNSAIYVVYGGPNGLPNITDLNSLTPSEGFKITGNSGLDMKLQGLTVTGIGDFNGDGRDDIAISSNINDSVYVIYGQSASTPITGVTLTSTGVVGAEGFLIKYSGPLGTDDLGRSVAGADLTGNGYSDLIVSDSSNTANTYVFYGQAGAPPSSPILVNNGTPTVPAGGPAYTILDGTNTNGLGSTVKAIGDVNGDGYTDFLVTMPGPAGGQGAIAGSAYVIFGGPQGLLHSGATISASALASMTPDQGFTITAEGWNEHLGGQGKAGTATQAAGQTSPQFPSVDGLGNIAGDGTNYYAIGSPGAINPTSSTTATGEGAGAVYVLPSGHISDITLPTWGVTGGHATWNFSGSNLATEGGFVIYDSKLAAQANGSNGNQSDLGFSVSSAGDVNGDGITDFLIGAPMANGGAGAVFLVFGEAGGLPGQSSGVVDLENLLHTGQPFGTPGTAVEFTGTAGSNLGTDVTAGDFNGSGINGYAFGGWWGGAAHAGQSFIYDGTTAELTQPYSNADDQVYYAGVSKFYETAVTSGVDHIATGAGNNDWVHGIGTDTASTVSLGHDSVDGGAGNDFVGLVGTSLNGVSGGAGWNTLALEGSGMTVNLAALGTKVQGFQQFDLDNQLNDVKTDPNHGYTGLTTHNTLELRLSDVLGESGLSANVGSTAPGANTNQHNVTILGSSSSTVQLLNSDKSDSSAVSSTQTSADPTNHGSYWEVTGAETLNISNGYTSTPVTFDIWHNTALGTSTAADLLIQHGVTVI
jgi:hypothetical protein